MINYLDFISNYGFPLALSIYLILRIDQLMTKAVSTKWFAEVEVAVPDTQVELSKLEPISVSIVSNSIRKETP